MKKYSYKVRQNYRASSIKGMGVAIFSCDKVREYFEEYFDKLEHIYIVSNHLEAKNIIEKIGDENISTIFTDIKKLYKKTNQKNAYLFYEGGIENEIVVLENRQESTTLNLGNNDKVTISNGTISETIKKSGRKVNKVIEINNGEVNLGIKIGGLWKVYGSNEINTHYLAQKKKSPKITSTTLTVPKPLINFKDVDNLVEFNGFDFTYENDSKYLCDLINWIIRDDFYSTLVSNIDKFGNFVNLSKKFKIQNLKGIDLLKLEIAKGKKINGIEYISIRSIGENTSKLSTQYGHFEIYENNGVVTINSFHSSLASEFDLKKFVESTMANLYFYISL